MHLARMASIPSSIIFDILTRLPIKSLLRLMTLNKLCSSFITDPHFIYTHFKKSSTANKDDDDKLCLILSCMEHRNLNTTIHFLTFDRSDDIDHELAVVEEYSVPVSFDSYQVLPSCKGLVCFYSLHGSVHVCNPSTKNIVRLPDSTDAEGFRSLSCGFGFDEIGGKHKFIKFLEPIEADNFVNYDNLRIETFTMGNDSWRKISYNPCFRFLHHEPPVFAGGFFYWITCASSSSNPVDHNPSGFSIVSFDIANEIFETISPPESISRKNWYNLYLVELRGELCLVDLDYESDEDRKRMDIWIKQKEQNNWVKEITIVHQSEPIDTTRPMASNGKEILLHGFIKGSGHLNWYNLETACFRQLKFKGMSSQYYYCNVSHHVESLFKVGY